MGAVLRGVSNRQRGRYAALSYAWGSEQRLTTTENNLSALQQGIDVSNLSKSLQDAIVVTHRLGIRYLWIDALCIIQKSPEADSEDFLIESAKMAQYYNNAYITIVAGCSNGSSAGFLDDRPQRAAGACRLDYSIPPTSAVAIPNVGPGLLYACLKSSQDIGPLTTRAWALQESELSRRALVFGSEQIAFSCQRRQAFEDGTVNALGWPGVTERSNEMHSPTMVDLRRGLAPPHAKLSMYQRWYDLLTDYTPRKLSDPEDKLSAIAGIASYMYPVVKSDYMFGIWADDLLRGLLWRSAVYMWRGFDRPTRSERLKRPTVARAPSWSWASLHGPIKPSQDSTSYGSPNYTLARLIAHRTPGMAFDPIRTGCSFELTLEGRLKEVRRTDLDVIGYNKRPSPPHVDTETLGRLGTAIALFEGVDRQEPTSHAVGIGLLDVFDEEDRWMRPVYAVPLTCFEGLLADAGPGRFCRLGPLYITEPEWARRGQVQQVVLV